MLTAAWADTLTVRLAWWLVGVRLSVLVGAVVGSAAAASEQRMLAIVLWIGVILCIAALIALESWRARGYRGR